jgi:ABC-type sugar transport system ATPase subunit
VDGVSLDVADGEFLALVGPSGCGKSTLLRLVAGLDTVSAGEVRIGGVVVNDVPPGARDVAMVFQSYALYPQMTVFENLAFALRVRGVRGEALRARVHAAAETMALTPLLDRRPAALSGGERQRVAVGRALVRDPAVFLFDEPLSNLDAALRVQVRRELAALHQRTRGTTLYVTHDQVEAMTLADRIAVIAGGRVQQVATPAELYARPANLFVATFIGSPAMNVLRGADAEAIGAPAGVDVGVRAEDLTLDGAAALRGRVEGVEYLGHEQLVHVRVGAASLVVRHAASAAPQVGEPVGVRIARAAWHCFDAATGARVDVPA